IAINSLVTKNLTTNLASPKNSHPAYIALRPRENTRFAIEQPTSGPPYASDVQPPPSDQNGRRTGSRQHASQMVSPTAKFGRSPHAGTERQARHRSDRLRWTRDRR